MIFVASLAAPVKRAYGDKAMSTTVQNIINQMSIDPKVSQMDACVLGVKDIAGINRAKVQSALKSKHPDVCVIYIYSRDKEGELIEVPFKECLKKITPETVHTCVDKFLGQQNIQSSNSAAPLREMAATIDIEKKQPARRTLGSSVKGSTLRKASEADENPTKQVKILHDNDMELDYKADVFGTKTYLDSEGNPMSPAQLQAHKDRLKIKREEERAAEEKRKKEQESLFDDEDDGLTVNMGNRKRSSDVPRTKQVEVTVYVDDDGHEVPPDHPEAKPVKKMKTVPNEDYLPKTTPKQTVERAKSQLEKNIESISDFHDWDYFKTALDKDTIVRELLEENATFQGVVQMLNVLDTDIKAVFYDRGLSADAKFSKIMEIGEKRSQLMASRNDIISNKIIDIIDTITISSRRTIEELLAQHRDAIEILSKQDLALADESTIHKAVESRSAIIIELMAAYKSIVWTLQVMNADVHDFITDLDKDLPSDNEFINKMIGSAAQICIPTNTAEIAKKLMDKITSLVSDNPASMAALGQYIWEFIDHTIELLQADEKIMLNQQNLIKLLQSHKVEDVVVIDGVLKNILNVYVGADGVGRTATTLVWSGCLSRRRNTLLIDMSNNSKLEDYGIQPIDIHKFMNERIDKPLCVVTGKPNDMEELGEFIRELKTRLDYYAYINVIVDDTQMDYAKMLCDEALTVNFITNCTNSSIESTKKCYAAIKTDNLARKLLLIDPPVSVLELAKRAGIDPLITRCVTIPPIQRIKTSSIMHDAPFEYTEVRAAFEEAFR